jgi:hypothetical protein
MYIKFLIFSFNFKTIHVVTKKFVFPYCLRHFLLGDIRYFFFFFKNKIDKTLYRCVEIYELNPFLGHKIELLIYIKIRILYCRRNSREL